MKKLLFLAFFAVFMIGCSSDSTEDLAENTDTEETTKDDDTTDNTDDDTSSKLTYTDDIKTIIMDNCIRCHGATPSNGAPSGSSFDTYAKVEANAISMQSRMNSISNPMPASRILPISTRNSFSQWITDGKLE